MAQERHYKVVVLSGVRIVGDVGEALCVLQVLVVDGVLEKKLGVLGPVGLDLDGHDFASFEIHARVNVAERAAANVLDKLELAGDLGGGVHSGLVGGAASIGHDERGNEDSEGERKSEGEFQVHELQVSPGGWGDLDKFNLKDGFGAGARVGAGIAVDHAADDRLKGPKRRKNENFLKVKRKKLLKIKMSTKNKTRPQTNTDL